MMAHDHVPRALRAEFPRMDLRPIAGVSLNSLYWDGKITRSQEAKILHHQLSHEATHFAVSTWGQVRIFSETMVWVVDGSGFLVFSRRR